MSTGRRARPLRDEERALWETVAKSIAPLKRRKVAPASADAQVVAEKPKRRTVHAPAPLLAPPVPSGPPALARLDRHMTRKVARGRHDVDARIDLHGMTQHEAHLALVRFLQRAQHDGARMALVITGKGARGVTPAGTDPYGERGVLRRQVPLWLESVELRAFVVGFEEAGRRHGGEGAIYVRVRKG